MMIKAIILFALAAAVAGFAQDSKDFPNKYIRSSDIYDGDIDKYQGINFLFYNVLKYDGDSYEPPFPYSDGRVRSGKYKASQSALENYLQNLSNYNGKKFKVVELANADKDMPGVIMACENGDTLLFNANVVEGQFVDEAYFNFQKKKIGTKLYYVNPTSNYPLIEKIIEEKKAKQFKEAYEYFYGFTENKSKKVFQYLPFLSRWKLVGVTYDTTFIGRNGVKENQTNAKFERIKWIIENSDYGKISLFKNNLDELYRVFAQKDSIEQDAKCRKDDRLYVQICLDRILPPSREMILAPNLNDVFYPINGNILIWSNGPQNSKDGAIVADWASKGYADAMFFNAIKSNGEIDDDIIIAAAKKGSLAAMHTYARAVQNVNDKDTKQILQVIIDEKYDSCRTKNALGHLMSYTLNRVKDFNTLDELKNLATKKGNTVVVKQIEDRISSKKENQKDAEKRDLIKKFEETIEATVKKQGAKVGFEQVKKLIDDYGDKWTVKLGRRMYYANQVHEQLIEFAMAPEMEKIKKGGSITPDDQKVIAYYTKMADLYKVAGKYGYTNAESQYDHYMDIVEEIKEKNMSFEQRTANKRARAHKKQLDVFKKKIAQMDKNKLLKEKINLEKKKKTYEDVQEQTKDNKYKEDSMKDVLELLNEMIKAIDAELKNR